MADRSSAMLLSALTRAAAEAGGAPLHAGKGGPGLFPSTALGKQAAQRSCEEGYLTPADGSGPACTITEKGMRYLLGQASPRPVLEDCVRILEEREGQLAALLASARQAQAGLEALRTTITGVVSKLDAPADLKSQLADFRRDPSPAILTALDAWASPGDCPLPELYRRADAPSVGSFHDALRRLHTEGKVWLHPWTGPLYEMPEPAFALLVGHEVSYYASARPGDR